MLYVGVGWVPAVFEDLANTISQSPIAWHGLGSRATAPRARAKSETLSHLRRRVVREKPTFDPHLPEGISQPHCFSTCDSSSSELNQYF